MNIVKGLNLIIALLLFLFCGSVYPIIFGANLLYVSLFLISVLLLILQKKYHYHHLKSFLKTTGVLMFFLTINWAITGFSLGFEEYLIMYSLIFIFNVAYVSLVNKESFSIENFDFAFVIILFYSFFNFLATNFLKYLFVPFSNDTFKCDHLFYTFFFSADYSVFDVEVVRNQGFYWEPGVLSVVLNIFLFRLLFGNYINYRKVLILSTSFLILTTFSTTGLFIMVVEFVYYLLKKRSSGFKKYFVLFLFSLMSIPILLNNLDEKVTGKGETSFLLRSYDALIALDIIKDNFFTGVGFSKIKNVEAQKKSSIFMDSVLTETRGNTNSVITVFLYLGIPLGISYLFLLYNQKIIRFNKGFFFFILLICLASEPLVFSGFFIFFVISSFYMPKGIVE